MKQKFSQSFNFLRIFQPVVVVNQRFTETAERLFEGVTLFFSRNAKLNIFIDIAFFRLTFYKTTF